MEPTSVWPQVIVNGMLSGLTYALVGVGFSLVYSTSRVFHFAHGAVFTAAAYSLYAVSVLLHASVFLGVAAALVVPIAVGWGVEALVYRRLRDSNSAPLAAMVASLGVYIFVQNALSLGFGDRFHVILPAGAGVVHTVAGARITLVQAVAIAASGVMLAALAVFIRYSHLGRAIRAVGSDSQLALAVGLQPDRIATVAILLGSGLASVAAVLRSLDVGVSPTMGMPVLLGAVVAVIVGGIGSVAGAAIGGTMLGLAQHLGALGVGGGWQDAVAFSVLLTFLLVCPHGVMGQRLRKAEV